MSARQSDLAGLNKTTLKSHRILSGDKLLKLFSLMQINTHAGNKTGHRFNIHAWGKAE